MRRPRRAYSLPQAIFQSFSFVESGTIFVHAPEPFCVATAVPSALGFG